MGLFSDIIGGRIDFGDPIEEFNKATSSREPDFPESDSTSISNNNTIDDAVENCSDCGGMGRTGGNHSYDTIGGYCPSCNGTGKKNYDQ
jgi:DnaJ-class molecular chaperone